jgi:hypothetical protein
MPGFSGLKNRTTIIYKEFRYYRLKRKNVFYDWRFSSLSGRFSSHLTAIPSPITATPALLAFFNGAEVTPDAGADEKRQK